MENGICLQLNILLHKVVAVLLGIFCLASILVFSCLPPLVHLDVLFILGIKHLQLLGVSFKFALTQSFKAL